MSLSLANATVSSASSDFRLYLSYFTYVASRKKSYSVNASEEQKNIAIIQIGLKFFENTYICNTSLLLPKSDENWRKFLCSLIESSVIWSITRNKGGLSEHFVCRSQSIIRPYNFIMKTEAGIGEKTLYRRDFRGQIYSTNTSNKAVKAIIARISELSSKVEPSLTANPQLSKDRKSSGDGGITKRLETRSYAERQVSN